MIEAKRYKAVAVAGTFQYGQSAKGNDQIAVDLRLDNGTTATTFLNFSDAARPYSEDRLVALGWGGPGTEIDEAELNNEVDVDISYEKYEGKDQMRVEIVRAGGRVKMKGALDETQKKAFRERISGVRAGAPKLDF